MSEMFGNPHYRGSMQFMSWARNGTRQANENDLSDDAAIFRAYAQNQATLALAYEQRTANLIAFYSDGGDTDAHHELHQQIVARLGLNDV